MCAIVANRGRNGRDLPVGHAVKGVYLAVSCIPLRYVAQIRLSYLPLLWITQWKSQEKSSVVDVVDYGPWVSLLVLMWA